jgi:hypothetical protein
MRKGTGVIVVVLAVAAGTYFLLGGIDHQSPLVELASAAPGNSGACTFPTAPAATPEQTAWEIFVAANCPAGNNQLVWETWVEQLQLYPANGQAGAGLVRGVRRLHGSPLAFALSSKTGGLAPLTPSNAGCNPLSRIPPAPPMIKKTKTQPSICEEVHLNPAAAQFITNAGYQTRPPQTKAAQQGVGIGFPTAAVEVKVDWIPASDFQTPFSCTHPPTGVHVEMIDGTCYAMAGMHISSKLMPNWLWATFEPQSMTTNPWRCKLFGPCNDPWGSNPAISNGGANGFTQLTSTLTGWMQQAGLASEFLNYRLDGVQTTFTDPASPDASPTILGNSIIEGENVGMHDNSASCITCHSVSSIKNDGTDGITLLGTPPPTGPQYKIPPDWIARDFVWSMGLACPDPKGGLQNCTNSAFSEVKKK